MIIEKPIIAKFGGSSVATAERILTIAEIIKEYHDNRPVVVVSALSGITDKLLALVKLPKSKIDSHLSEIRQIHLVLIKKLFTTSRRGEVIKYLNERITELRTLLYSRRNGLMFQDKIASFGEIISSFLVSHALRQQGIDARQVIATECITTTNVFGSADFIPDLTEKKVKKTIKPLLSEGVIPVVTGFLGSTADNKVTTLGRGGSDYTASILGFCLNAKEVQIWTDVDGVFTADPKIVENARLITQISYKEASEMATFGAKVLHPRTIRPAISRNIPVRVLNTFNPQSQGTLITHELIGKKGIKAVASKSKTTLINIYSTDMLFSKGYLAKVFDIFAKEDISIDLVSVSEVSVSITLDENLKISHAISKLKEFAEVTYSADVGTVSLIGEDVIESSHVLTEVSDLFHQNKISIKMISFGASNVNISFVVDKENVEKAVRLVHAQILSKAPIREKPVYTNGGYMGGLEA